PPISRTFATDVMCKPTLLAICDPVHLPSCARYQLNIGHLLQRGPGADEQWLHRDESVWSDVPWPHPELQLASVIAFVDFTRDNGATRVVPGSHHWPDRQLSPAEQAARPPVAPEHIAYAEMPKGSAVVYTGGTIHAGGSNVTDIPRRGAHLSYCLGWLRTEENNYLAVPPAVPATRDARSGAGRLPTDRTRMPRLDDRPCRPRRARGLRLAGGRRARRHRRARQQRGGRAVRSRDDAALDRRRVPTAYRLPLAR